MDGLTATIGVLAAAQEFRSSEVMEMPWDSHEKAIVTRALEKDPRALEQLLFLRYDWLIAVARRTIPRDLWEVIEAEDVVQDASIKIFTGFDQFVSAGEGALFQWMQTITRRVAIEHLRKLGRTPTSNNVRSGRVEALLDDLKVLDPTASSVLRRKELSRTFAVALEKLEPKYRRTIEMLYLESKSVAEVAQLLGISEPAVRGYRQRARKKLKESINRLSLYV